MSTLKQLSLKCTWWFSGRILACHAGGPSSIPGRCILFHIYSRKLIVKLLFCVSDAVSRFFFEIAQPVKSEVGGIAS